MMNKSYTDSVSIVSTGLPVRTQWRYLGPDLGSGSASVSAKDYVTLERYKRNLGRPFRSTRANATAISCVILTTLLFFVGALFLALYLIKPTVTGGWSEWSHWSECSRSCGRGEQFRNRSCTTALSDPGGLDCRGADTEMKECNTQDCDDAPETGMPPVVAGFRSVRYSPGDLRSVYICDDISTSIDINSGSRACPVVEYKNHKWDNFTATCGQAQTFGTELQGIGGSFFASSGYITSPNYPSTFPNEYGVYQWTIVSPTGSITFSFTHLNMKKKRPDCKGTSSVAIYCGMDIPPLEPTYGYYCGDRIPKTVTCTSGCAIVRFISIPMAESYTGFRLEWTDDAR